jgi:hypothetical protein
MIVGRVGNHDQDVLLMAIWGGLPLHSGAGCPKLLRIIKDA